MDGNKYLIEPMNEETIKRMVALTMRLNDLGRKISKIRRLPREQRGPLLIREVRGEGSLYLELTANGSVNLCGKFLGLHAEHNLIECDGYIGHPPTEALSETEALIEKALIEIPDVKDEYED